MEVPPRPAALRFHAGMPVLRDSPPFPTLKAGYLYTLPLNGLKNYNFFYTADGNGFLSGGGYQVTYLNASLATCYGPSDIVDYSPNRAHTNGVQVRPFNGTLTEPRGVHGIAKGLVPNGGGAVVPLENAVVFLTAAGAGVPKAKTNGNGYFSIYYDSQTAQSFLPDIFHWTISVQGFYNGCLYTGSYGDQTIWMPDTNPNSPTYYVNQGAAWDAGTLILPPNSPCQQ